MLPIEIENLSFSYNSHTSVFENISFSVNPGEVFCIIGPNGCGKTTLIDCILGLHHPQTGVIKLSGKPMEKLKAQEFARHIAYVPQNHVKTFPYSVLDIVIMGRTFSTSWFSSPGSNDINKAREALNLVGLSNFENRPYTQLSGGELQLVLIARAIAQEAKILVLDEPTAHLDFCHELLVMELLTQLANEHNLSILMATHFLNQAFYLENAQTKTRVALMHKGEFKASGSPDEVLTAENMQAFFNVLSTTGITVEDGQSRKFIIPVKNIRSKP